VPEPVLSAPAIRFGEADLTTCDREPIRIPGSIQPHGILLVLDRRTRLVEQTAGDTRFLLGLDPPRVVGLALGDILEPEAEAFVRASIDGAAAHVAPSVRLGVRSRSGALPLDLTIHADTTTALPAPQSQDAVTGQACCPGHLYQFSQHISRRFIYTGASAISVSSASPT